MLTSGAAILAYLENEPVVQNQVRIWAQLSIKSEAYFNCGEIMEILSYIGSFLFVIALIGIGAWFLKNYLMGTEGNSVSLFGNKERKRIGVVESANVDGRRKLLLIRRDDKEHLIMTGGPVDVLIENGISGSSVHNGSGAGDSLGSQVHNQESAPEHGET